MFLETIAIKCINPNKGTGLYLKDTTIEEITNKYVSNEILHNVGMSWII